MEQKHFEIPIAGMHCSSCEVLLERRLKEIPGVHSVTVSKGKGTALITASETVHKRDCESVIKKAGYTIGRGGKLPWLSRHRKDYLTAAASALVLFALYKILSASDAFSASGLGSNPSLALVPFVGVIAGVSTCMALVGGLVLAVSTRHAELHPEATGMQKFRPHLYFNLGRLASYAVFGGIIGALGSAFKVSFGAMGAVIIIAGAVMVVLGLKLTELFPRLSNATISLPKSLSRALGIGNDVKEYSHTAAMLSGAATFFVPCGFTQAMQLYAISTGSAAQGAAIMFLFALGTVPGLMGVGALTSFVSGSALKSFGRVIGVLVLFLGLWTARNGFNLTGWSIASAARPEVAVSGEIQVVRMEQNARGYVPNRLTVQAGRPVRWIINSTYPYSCSSFLVVPSMRLSKDLQEGENVIEFTPTKPGTIKFTCSMGMYSGYFSVVQ